jgi:predicted extracellular nuclease
MKLTRMRALALTCAVGAAPANAGVFISEFSRGGGAGEFVEIVNTGPGPVDTTGWSFDDVSAVAGAFPFGSAIGVLAVGEAAIVSELDAATFRTNWGLASTVKVVGGNDQNLGNGDTMNIFDSAGALVATQSYPGGGAVVDGETWATPASNYGLDNFAGFVESAAGDQFGSFLSNTSPSYYGSPGTAPIPEPLALPMAALIGAAAVTARRPKRRS